MQEPVSRCWIVNSRWESAEDRFYNQHSVNPQTHCWEWIGATAGRGYGRIQVNGEKVYAHRLSWQMHNGEIPDGLFVCHHCDNVLCVNPDHLFLGTHSDNMQDMVRKGKHNSQKISDSARVWIANSELPTNVLAKAFNVHRTTIQRIRRTTQTKESDI
jgi:hypothetical protein